MAKSEYSFDGVRRGVDGSKWWYKNSILHREDGPAIEWADGSKSWYIDGMLHREDGPAVERNFSARLPKFEYWLFNVTIPKEKFTPEYILEVKLSRIIET
jgi:hypothetical protein